MCQLLGIRGGKTTADVKHSHMAVRFLSKCALNRKKKKKKREVIFKHKGYGMKEEKARRFKKKKLALS